MVIESPAWSVWVAPAAPVETVTTLPSSERPPSCVALGAAPIATVSGWIALACWKPGPNVATWTSLPPPKCRRAADCTSLIAAWFDDVYVEISWRLRCEKYGSLCAARSSVEQMPAYAMIDEPEPGSTDVAWLRLPPEQFSWLPLNGWLPLNWWPISCAT